MMLALLLIAACGGGPKAERRVAKRAAEIEREHVTRVDPRFPAPPAFPDDPLRIAISDDGDDGERQGAELHLDPAGDVIHVADDRVAMLVFRIPEGLPADPVAARLVLPTLPSGLGRLRVSGPEGAVTWDVPGGWPDPYAAGSGRDALPRTCAPVERWSPDLAALLAGHAGATSLTVTLRAEEGSFAFQDRMDVADPACPGVLSARLEVFPTLRSALVGRELLGRPTDASVTVSLASLVPIEAYVEYAGASDPGWTGRTDPRRTDADGALQLAVTGLAPDTAYRWRLRMRRAGSDAEPEAGPVGRFHTARAPGQPFTLDVTSDGHFVNMDNRRDLRAMHLLRHTMDLVAADDPDLLLDLGDTFNTESYRGFDVQDREETWRRVLDVRRYFEVAGAPVMLAPGNHEGEQGWRIAAGDPVPGLTLAARRALFPNPLPGPYVTGNAEIVDGGPPGDYFAIPWGDALIVVLDPYRYTVRKPHDLDGTPGSGDRWDWTLGEAQYRWLQGVLRTSHATFKLVFSHQVTGGTNDYGRGGRPAQAPGRKAEGSYEWGGLNDDGTPGFAERRPGWEEPVHALLAETGVAAFVHGHDHVFVAEPPLDGVVYLTAPQPGDPDYASGHAERSGYGPGTRVRPNSGWLRIRVTPRETRVEYVRSFLPGEGPDGAVDDSVFLRDCDGNGVPDLHDIARGAPDADGDGRLDGCAG